MISTIVAVAGGGALGALARFGMNSALVKMLGEGFPWGTLIANVLGSFVMGLLVATMANFWQPSQEIRMFLITGFLGAFTTFSAFSLDFAALWGRSEFGAAAVYASASVFVSIAALFAAMALIRSVVS